MATWVIGDIQGCLEAFDALLEMLDPDPGTDRIWLAGDLVNRGPDSLGVLRRAMGMGAECVLGNHDLHLLAVAQGARPCAASDTFGPVLAAPDRERLLDWLRRRPLLHHDEGIGWTMVHGGLPPDWDLATARRRAAEVEEVLAGERAAAFLAHLYGNEASVEEAAECGWGHLRYTLNALTRIRYVTGDGRLDLSFAGAPERRPEGLVPWFSAPARRSPGGTGGLRPLGDPRPRSGDRRTRERPPRGHRVRVGRAADRPRSSVRGGAIGGLPLQHHELVAEGRRRAGREPLALALLPLGRVPFGEPDVAGEVRVDPGEVQAPWLSGSASR